MNLKVLRLALFVLVALVQFGCASTDSASDTPPDLAPAPTREDDSHGWGTSVKGI